MWNIWPVTCSDGIVRCFPGKTEKEAIDHARENGYLGRPCNA